MHCAGETYPSVPLTGIPPDPLQPIAVATLVRLPFCRMLSMSTHIQLSGLSLCQFAPAAAAEEAMSMSSDVKNAFPAIMVSPITSLQFYYGLGARQNAQTAYFNIGFPQFETEGYLRRLFQR